MAQIKIYGDKSALASVRDRLSRVIHSCAVDALGLPADKRFHRFFGLDPEDFVYPDGRSQRYTIVEVSMFEGRSAQAKKAFIRLLYERAKSEIDLDATDLEITISETPRANWGIRGLPGDELELGYKVTV
jgi:phenylpyruvate tautomerase PptA (4-oxalocrotonate tautomerase family)